MKTNTVDLDSSRKYVAVTKTVDREAQAKRVDAILGRAVYPKRLFRGLDDLSLAELRDALLSKTVLTVGLRLTNVCNYACIYCGTLAKRGKDAAGTLSTDEYKRIIADAAEIGARSIVFGANGEPMLTKDVLPILEYTRSCGLIPIMFSNCSVIGNDDLSIRKHGVDGQEFLERMEEAGTSLFVSVESLQEERYDHIMGVKSFRSFERAVERLRRSPITKTTEYEGRVLCRIAVSCVVMPINYDERTAMVEFAHSIGGLAILKPPSLHGAAAENRDQMFTVSEALPIRKEVEALSDKQATLQILTLACGSWTLSMSIDSEGFYMSCMTEEVNPFGVGMNVRQAPLKDMLGRRNELNKLGTSICPVKDKFYVRT